jgi:hypothetical protein
MDELRSELDRGSNAIETTHITAQGFHRAPADGITTDQTATRQRDDVGTILGREAADLADGEIDPCQKANFQYLRIHAIDRHWHRVCVRIFVHERERVIVLPVEIQQARLAVGVTISNVQIVRQDNAS